MGLLPARPFLVRPRATGHSPLACVTLCQTWCRIVLTSPQPGQTKGGSHVGEVGRYTNRNPARLTNREAERSDVVSCAHHYLVGCPFCLQRHDLPKFSTGLSGLYAVPVGESAVYVLD